jgi:uncharacterized protein YndB with AHSA1/START domain
MKFRHEITYDAPAAEVYAMLTDPAFRQRSCDAMGVLSADITIEPHGPGATVVIDQVQPTEGVPGFAKKIAGESTRAIQTEEWVDGLWATMTVQTPGKPTEISGRLTLTETGTTTVESFEGESKAKVPLIGGKLEALVADLFKAGMDKEHAAGVAWLKGER